MLSGLTALAIAAARRALRMPRAAAAGAGGDAARLDLLAGSVLILVGVALAARPGRKGFA